MCVVSERADRSMLGAVPRSAWWLPIWAEYQGLGRLRDRPAVSVCVRPGSPRLSTMFDYYLDST